MAIYTWRCTFCSQKAETVQSIKAYCERPHVPECPACKVSMERYLTPTLVSFDTAPWAAYQSPIDGEVIDSRAKRNEHMAKHGVVMFDDIKPDVERNKKRILAEQKQELRNDVIEGLKMAEAGAIVKPQVAEAGYDPIMPGQV
jgi:predicted nucleic acid-binding Zn ribbon protein